MFEKMKRAKRVMNYITKMRTSEIIKTDVQIDITKRIQDIENAQTAGKLNHLYPDTIENYIIDLKKLIELHEKLDKPGQKEILKHLKYLKDRYDKLDKAIDKAIGEVRG